MDLGDVSEGLHDPAVELPRRLAFRHCMVFAKLQPVLPGARVQALDFVSPHAFDHAEVLLAQCNGGHDLQPEYLRGRRSGLLRTHQVAADQVIDRLVGQPQPEPSGLLMAHVIEGNVDVALKAEFAVPVGFTVADQNEFGSGHRQGHIVPAESDGDVSVFIAENSPMPTLILLPGLACDARLWEAQIPSLPRSLGVEVTDVHMRHDRIETMAAALLSEHSGSLILCGASMGGMIAMEAARQAPDRIAGLALLGTNARPETPDMYELRKSAIELFERGEARDVIELNAGFAFHPIQARDAALVQRYIDLILDAGTAQLIRQNRALMERPDQRPHLARLQCPTLVMCGDGDRLTPPECSREIAALMPHAEVAWVPQCGHMLTMEKPEFVNSTLRRWLVPLSPSS